MAAHVAILMGTLNGAPFLSAQLASFMAQSHTTWSLHASDDGSDDGTRELITEFASNHSDHMITMRDGPKRGSAANYFALLEGQDWPEGAWLAFSDQDDVWMADRLERAMGQLSDVSGPAVYASRTLVTASDLTPIGPSRRHSHAPAFGNALTQNILAGNTIVLNPAAAQLAHQTASVARSCGVPHHDWWLYQLFTGVGAHIVLDDRPGVYYRQHQDNVLGASRGMRKAIDRLAMIWDGRYGDWMRCNVAGLRQIDDNLTEENTASLNHFDDWLNGVARGPFGGGLAAGGIWRQTAFGSAVLRAAACLGRI